MTKYEFGASQEAPFVFLEQENCRYLSNECKNNFDFEVFYEQK